LRRWSDSQLVLNTYGAYLRKKGDCFQVKLEEKNVEIPVAKVDSILIATSAMLSTDAIQCAVDNNIDLVFLDQYGDPYARVWHAKMGSTTLIRRRQLTATESEMGIRIVAKWSLQKLRNQIDFLKRLKRTRPGKAEEYETALAEITAMAEQLETLTGTVDESRHKILGLEGNASRAYWSAISFSLPEEWRFEGRSRQPAKDPFNATLNYGYGILYSLVEKACIIAGLDPYVGILHTDNYNKKSFVFDAIEPYRIYVDETVVFLFTRKQMRPEHFERIEGGVTLSKEGKAVLITSINSRFDEEETHRGRRMQVRNILQAELHTTANGLLEAA